MQDNNNHSHSHLSTLFCKKQPLTHMMKSVMFKGTFHPNEEQGMSDIVIRHAEPKDIEAIRQIHAQPEVYHNTLQVPHPSEHMWQERLRDTAGVKQLVACIEGQVVGHLTIAVAQRPRRSHVADFGISVDSRWHNRGIASALMHTMIDMCDNWLRVDRIELTVFVDNTPAVAVYKKYGFEIEGTGKRYALRNGEYVDAYYMARMK
jgi:putative acetyltransferase